MVLRYGISSPQKKYVTTVSPLHIPWLTTPFLHSFILKVHEEEEKGVLEGVDTLVILKTMIKREIRNGAILLKGSNYFVYRRQY